MDAPSKPPSRVGPRLVSAGEARPACLRVRRRRRKKRELEGQQSRVANGKLAEQVREMVIAKAHAEAKAADALHERNLVVKALETARQDLDQFVYAASHDLKAPLRGIASLSEWLEEDLRTVITPKSQEHLRLLRGRVHRMEALINGLLAYSRASRAKEELEPILVAPFLGELVALVAPPPSRVTIAISEAMPPVTVERMAFQEVWTNLIDNALKHAPGAAIRLTARDAGDAWEFGVSDDGPGIAPRYHERIFRLFQILAPRDRVESTGLGLAIVKKLIEERGGHVWVESTIGNGATFCFTWRKP